MRKIEWCRSDTPQDYTRAVAFMEERAVAIHEGKGPETVWFLEHPSLYTAGTSARKPDLLTPRFPVHQTGRGGQYTYHGPGQRVAYVMLDLKSRQKTPDIKGYVYQLEEWIILSLAALGVKGERREGRIGIWVTTPAGEKKIAALGVRVRHWVTYHGIAINVNPDLSHFEDIVPCGVKEYGVTSLHDLGVQASLEDLDEVLRNQWDGVFK